jgi:hypothetical protein
VKTLKKDTLNISFEKEKLDAIRYFAEQKGSELQDELDAFLLKLYEKYVPEPTRKYIESKAAAAKPERRKTPSASGGGSGNAV